MSTLFKKVTSVVGAVTIAVSAVSSTLTVSAASNFAPYADALATAGIISKQTTEAGYNLGNNVTRAEMAKIAVNIKKATVTECTGKVFSDVTSKLGDLCGYVEAAANAGLVNKTATKFRPMDLVTRAEMLKMLLSAQGIAPTTEDMGFKDLPKDATLSGYINAAAKAGIINKGTSFNPNNTASRGESFKVASNSAGLTTTSTVEANNGSDSLDLGNLFGDTTSTGTTASTGTTVSTGTTSTGTTTMPVGVGDVTVALSPANPPATTLGSSTAYNTVLAIDVTAGSADVAVKGLKVVKSGLAANGSVTGLTIWANNVRLGPVVTTLGTDGSAIVGFANTPLIVKAGATQTVYVKANLKSDASGTVQFRVDSVDSTAATTNGVSTLVGNTMQVVTATVPSYSITAQSVGGQATGLTQGNVSVGDLQKEVGKFKFTNNSASEDLKIENVVVYVPGTITETTDLANWTLSDPSGNVIATAVKSVDRYVTFLLSTPFTVAQGTNKILTVKVDVTGGSGREFRTSIQNDYDVLVKAATNNVYVLPASFTEQSDTSTGYFKMRSGTTSISKSTSSPSGNIAQGGTDILLGSFNVTAAGEDFEVRKVSFDVVNSAYTVPRGNHLTGNIKVTVGSGSAVSTLLSIASTETGLGDATAATITKDLSTYYTIKAGTTVTLNLVGSVSSSSDSTDKYTAYVYDLYGKRLSTNDFANGVGGNSVSTSPVTANQLSVSTAALIVAKNTSVGSKNVAPGATSVVIGSYTLSAGSAEDINVSTITVDLADATAITNLKLTDGSNTLGTVISTPSTTGNSFSVSPFKITKNGSKTINVVADLKTNYAVGNIQTGLKVSATGVDSSSDASDTTNGAITVAAVAAAQTFTITGPASGAGNVTAVIGGTTVTAAVANTDTATAIATALKNAINADTVVNKKVVATSSLGVVTVTALVKGAAANSITTTAATTAAGVANTAGAATLAAGANATGGAQVMTFAAGSMTVTKDSGSANSKILTPSSTHVELAKFKFAAANEPLTLNKLRFDVSANAANFGEFKLVKGGVTLGTANLNGTKVVFSGLNEVVAADSNVVLSVMAVINDSGVMNPGTVAHISFSDAVSDTEVRGSAGLLASGTDITGNGVASSDFLFHNSKPLITVATDTPSGTLTPSADQVVAKYTITNQGTRDLRIGQIKFTLNASGLDGVATTRITSYKLYNGATQLGATDTAAAAVILGTETSGTPTFTALGTTLVVSAGSSVTLTLKADTSAIRTGLSSTSQARITTKIDGLNGFASGNAVNETDWNDGDVQYYYTPVAGSENGTAYVASDEYPVTASTLTY